MSIQKNAENFRKGKELTDEQLKEIELNILREIKYVCDKNNLKFFLCGGTLLGAIRHNGFIPWDDDIDIYMPREDYSKFITLFNEHSSKEYKFICMENTPAYCIPFGKAVCTETSLFETQVQSTPGMGVYVDVFPLDGLGDSLDEAKHIISKCGQYRHRLEQAMSNKRQATPINVFKNWGCKMLYLCRRIIYSKYLKMSEKNPFETSKYVAFCGAFYGEKEILEQKIFLASKLHEFENELYPIPVGYDTYLKKLYGDYMMLPPVEKRVTHHSFVAYYKEAGK